MHHKVGVDCALIYVHSVESACWRQSRWRSRRETIELSLSPEASCIYNARAIAAKISGFITGEGSKTCFKACIVGIDSSFSLALCSTAQPHSSARAELSSCGVPRHNLCCESPVPSILGQGRCIQIFNLTTRLERCNCYVSSRGLVLYLRSYRSEIARIRKLKMGLSQSPAGRLEPRYVAAIAVFQNTKPKFMQWFASSLSP